MQLDSETNEFRDSNIFQDFLSVYLHLHQLRLVFQSAIDLVASTTDINFPQFQRRGGGRMASLVQGKGSLLVLQMGADLCLLAHQCLAYRNNSV